MAPNINNPGGVKNDPNEIRDGVVSDSTRFPGGFIDQRVTESGAPVTPKGQFNLTNASTLDAANLEPTLDSPLGLFIRPDGSQIYVGDEPNLDVYEISLSTPFDITSLSIGSSFSIGSRVSLLKGLTLTSNGDRLHISDGGNNKLFQYDLSTDFDITTASFDTSLDVSPQDSSPRGITLEQNDSRLYLLGNANTKIYEYSLSTNGDISTATFSRSFDTTSQTTSPLGVDFNDDGSRMFISDGSGVFQYRLFTDFDITTARFDTSFSFGSFVSSAHGALFDPTGSRLYAVGETSRNVVAHKVETLVGELP